MSEEQTPVEAEAPAEQTVGDLTTPAEKTWEAPTEASNPTENPADWRATLPEDLRGDTILEKYKSNDDAIKALVNAQRKLGSAINIPGEDASDEDREEFFKKLGVPESADKYRLPTEGLPDDVTPDEEMIKGLAEEAHKAGVPEKAFAQLYRRFMEVSSEKQKAASAQTEQNVEKVTSELKAEWGDAFDERLSLARKGMAFAGGDEMAQMFRDTGLDMQYPQLIKSFYKVGRELAGDEIMGKGSRASFALSPTEALNEIEAIRSDPANMKAMSEPHNPQSKVINKKLEDLYKMAYPES